MTLLGKKLLALAAILISVFAVYSNSFQGVFVFDDFINIVNNPALHTWRTAISNSSRPITNLTFWVQYKLGMSHAADFHIVNVMLHAVNSVLLWLLLWKVTRRVAASRRLLFSTAATLLWAVHPIHTESVTYIVQRAEVLSVLFMLAGLLFGVMAMRRRSKACMVGVAAAFGMAFASKPTAVSAPFLLLLLDSVAVSGGMRKAWRDNRILHAVSLASLLIPIYMLSGSHESGTSAGFSMQFLSYGQHLAFQPRALVMYVAKLVWPRNLVMDYGLDVEHELLPVLLFSVVLCVGVLAIWRVSRQGGVSRLGLYWFFLALGPVIFVPLADLFAEHRLYLASAGFALLISAGLLDVTRRVIPGKDRKCIGFMVVVAMLTLSLGIRTWTRNRDYRDPLILWQQVVDLTGGNVRGHLGVGAALARRGDVRGAEGAFRLAVAAYRACECEFLKESFRTDYAYACRNLGVVLNAQGQGAEAQIFLDEADKNASEFR